MAAQLHSMQIFLRSGASLKRHFPKIINIQGTWRSQLKLLGFEWYLGAQHELVTIDLLTGCLLKGWENELRLKEDKKLFFVGNFGLTFCFCGSSVIEVLTTLYKLKSEQRCGNMATLEYSVVQDSKTGKD